MPLKYQLADYILYSEVGTEVSQTHDASVIWLLYSEIRLFVTFA